MKNVLLVKYGEIAIRGKNRYIYEGKLMKAIKSNLEALGLSDYKVIKEQGRILVEHETEDVDYDKVIPKLKNIFGIIGVSPCYKTENQDIENLSQLGLQYFKAFYENEQVTFKVVTKRSNKKYPLESNEVSYEVGGYILNHCENISVDVRNPQVVITVELRNNAYIYSKTIKGYGGLPQNSTGKATLLLSGGIDSPVAGFLTAKRGVEIDAVYFESPPYTSERAREKVISLAERLSEFTGGFQLYVVDITEIQLYLYEKVQEEKLTVLLKRTMTKIADEIARQNGSQALITGDSIGQVASQTLQAMNSINSAAKLPIIRPLATMDKQEIVDLAKEIGTFETSILPYEDCCTIFVPKHPETKPKASIIEKIESKLVELDQMHMDSIQKVKIIKIGG